jgi:hypothetical protein
MRFEVHRPKEKLVMFLCPLQGLQRYARLHPSLFPLMDSVQIVASFPRNNSLVIYMVILSTQKFNKFVGIIMGKRNIKTTS